ncbi:4'-phosphopantetheinyl transferase [Streptomyces sp. Wb2n-11]|uniref:4'-phosphopantetheinyl transferase family protein n=1 Tax=Streptomyces sp. Wb2n-11 TaxID=1030533 RepID=UPI000AC3EC7E|nr:4'-phosphopantetheinyl transferase superfamily protein [Streptomyces sp. Wb2n-11]
MIGSILPPEARWSEVSGDFADGDPVEDGLFPEEEWHIRNAVGPRRREFTTARICARRALRRLGVAPGPLLPDARGAPRWPRGVTGSITHCSGYRSCAVAPLAAVASLGIDAEPNQRLSPGVLAVVALPSEARRIGELAAGTPGVCWDRLLFSAKEALYKAWYPLTGMPISFEHAEVRLEPERGTFRARMLVAAPEGRRVPPIQGRFLLVDGLLLTSAVCRAGPG